VVINRSNRNFMLAESILTSVCALRLAYVCPFLTRIVTTYMLVLFINNYIETNSHRQICDWTYVLSMAEMHATSSHTACTPAVRIRDRGNNDTVRRSEKIPTVPCIYWPINGPAAMYVVSTEKCRCFPRNRPRFTKCDHATLQQLYSQLKEALSWTHYPSVEVEGVTNKTNPSLYGFKMGIAKFEAFTAVLKKVQYWDVSLVDW
jgi:hypothetical protein